VGRPPKKRRLPLIHGVLPICDNVKNQRLAMRTNLPAAADVFRCILVLNHANLLALSRRFYEKDKR